MMNMQQQVVNESWCSSDIAYCQAKIPGFCQITIPKGLKEYDLQIPTLATYRRNTSSFAPCSFSFLVDKDYYHPIAAAINFSDPKFADKARAFPRVLDRAVGISHAKKLDRTPPILHAEATPLVPIPPTALDIVAVASKDLMGIHISLKDAE
ncbi:hypothetical protein ACLOJK_041629 [Asimina triloba]